MSGFAYGGKTLDELRALAESPQVGRMYEMQAGFQKIADHMDGVVSALGRLRADLPNWWTGAAADQAVSAFSQVVSVAQRVHENADGAAAALGRCATVVSQQQAAMQDVPYVVEPGAGAPGGAPNPMAAQEAAAYRAARERAVQVVNGIAAQYVETQAKFADISGNYFDSGFQVIQSAASGTGSTTTAGAAPSPHPVASQNASGMQPPLTQTGSGRTAISTVAGEFQQRLGVQTGLAQNMPTPSSRPSASPMQSASPTTSKPSARTTPLMPSTAGSSEIGLMPLAAGAVIATGIAVAGKRGTVATFDPLTDASAPHAASQSKRSQIRSTSHSIQPDDPLIATGDRSVAHDETIERDRLEPLYQQSEDRNLGMYGAPGSVGGYVHGTDSRKKRASYVKESKSAWLSDESAAPPNGLLTPGWADPE